MRVITLLFSQGSLSVQCNSGKDQAVSVRRMPYWHNFLDALWDQIVSMKYHMERRRVFARFALSCFSTMQMKRVGRRDRG